MSFNSTLMTNVTVAAAARIGGPLATLSIFVIRFAPICFLDHVPLTGKQLLPDMFHVHRSFSKKRPFLNKGDIDYMDCRKSDGSKMLGFLATKSRSVKLFRFSWVCLKLRIPTKFYAINCWRTLDLHSGVRTYLQKIPTIFEAKNEKMTQTPNEKLKRGSIFAEKKLTH